MSGRRPVAFVRPPPQHRSMVSAGRIFLLGATLGLSSAACLGDRPTRSGETGSDGGTQPPPSQCAVEAPGQTPPFPTTFRFRNDTDAPVFLYRGCIGVDYGISSCASGFRDQVGPVFRCSCACDQAFCTSPPSCGPCPPPEGAMVRPGDSVLVDWDAIAVSEHDKASSSGGTFQCVRSTPVAAGKYRVAVRVFDDQVSASRNSGGRVVTRDFPLPNAGPVVDVPLATRAEEACDAAPDESAPACTGAERRDVPCVLGESLDFAWEGGLGFYTDSMQLSAPSTFSRRRVFRDTAMPDLTCRTPIPRCARDSRVVTTSDVVRVIAAPGVTSVFAAGTTPVYGYDARANDGSILVLRRPNGTSLGIGTDCPGCSSGASARSLTPALRAVVPAFSALDRQLTATPACSAFGAF